MSVNSQGLNRRGRIERRAQPPGALGHAVDVWDLVSEVWASVKPLGGRELIAAQAVQAELTHTVMVRHQRALDNPVQAAQWRFVLRDRTFNILAARDVHDGHRWIIFDCREGGADGH